MSLSSLGVEDGQVIAEEVRTELRFLYDVDSEEAQGAITTNHHHYHIGLGETSPPPPPHSFTLPPLLCTSPTSQVPSKLCRALT